MISWNLLELIIIFDFIRVISGYPGFDSYYNQEASRIVIFKTSQADIKSKVTTKLKVTTQSLKSSHHTLPSIPSPLTVHPRQPLHLAQSVGSEIKLILILITPQRPSSSPQVRPHITTEPSRKFQESAHNIVTTRKSHSKYCTNRNRPEPTATATTDRFWPQIDRI